MFVLFEETGKFLAGRILSEADSSLQVELDSGKRVKVKAANALLKFEKPAPAALIAAHAREHQPAEVRIVLHGGEPLLVGARHLEELLEVSIPLGELPEDARAWERGVDELAEEDEDVADYIHSLEESRDTAELPEASGEAIAREFERYLKRRDQD